MFMPAPSWYVCQAKPRQEEKAMSRLSEQGYDVYLPKLTRWERKKGAWLRTEQVMFPRYSFVRCGRAGQSIAPIRCTPGVLGLVRFGGEPACLSDAAVVAIRELAERSGNEMAAKAAPFSAGMSVAVADGPLKGLSGLVSDVADQRVAVLLTLLGAEQRIVFPANHLVAA
jgi:transcriptional antiterminator RfaH